MHLLSRVLAITIGLTVLAPIARAQAPAAPAPTYDAKFVVGDDAVEYVGTTTFVVGEKGDVAGALTITGPLEGTGTLSGPVKDGSWAARVEFTLPTQSCSGVVSGTATVPADRKVISGTGTVVGSCAADPQNTTFTFTRK